MRSLATTRQCCSSLRSSFRSNNDDRRFAPHSKRSNVTKVLEGYPYGMFEEGPGRPCKVSLFTLSLFMKAKPTGKQRTPRNLTCFFSFLANLSKFLTCISASAAGSAGSTRACCSMRVTRTFFVRAFARAIASSDMINKVPGGWRSSQPIDYWVLISRMTQD